VEKAGYVVSVTKGSVRMLCAIRYDTIRTTCSKLKRSRLSHQKITKKYIKIYVETRSSAIADTARAVALRLRSVTAVDHLTLTVTINMDLCKFYFTNRVVNTWNYVVS